MEKDNEVAGSGNSYTADYWQYDSRIGRRWNMDPAWKNMPGSSPYVAYINCPLVVKDPKGDFGVLGFFIGFGSDLAMQMITNAALGKPIYEVDLADAFIAGAIGAVTGGTGSLAKLGATMTKQGKRLLNAAGIKGKVASTSISVVREFTENGVKATIDIEVTSEDGEYVKTQTVFGTGEYAKDWGDAAGEAIIGTITTIGTKQASGLIKEEVTEFVTKELKEHEKQLLRELGRVEYSGEIYKKIEQKITTTAEKVVFEETITEKVVDGLTKIANSKIEESMKDGAKKIAD